MAANSICIVTIPIFMMFFVSTRVFKTFLKLSVLFRKPYGYDAALRQSLKLCTPFLTYQVLVLLISKVIIWWPFLISPVYSFLNEILPSFSKDLKFFQVSYRCFKLFRLRDYTVGMPVPRFLHIVLFCENIVFLTK